MTEIPPRVLAAEARRDFRQLLNRSSLGCPNGQCDHLIADHVNEWDDDGNSTDAFCSKADCLCDSKRVLQ